MPFYEIYDIEKYEPREVVVHSLRQLYFQFGQPSADNEPDWAKIAVVMTLMLPIRTSISQLHELLWEQVFNDNPS